MASDVPRRRLLVGLDAAPDDRQVGATVVQERREAEPAHAFDDARILCKQRADRALIGKQLVLGPAGSAVEVTMPRDLEVPRLGMDQRLRELLEQVNDKAAAQDQGDHAEGDRRERQRRPRRLAQDVAERELEHGSGRRRLAIAPERIDDVHPRCLPRGIDVRQRAS